MDPYGLEPEVKHETPMSFPAKVIGVFLKPEKTFEAIRTKPDILMPYLLTMIVFAIFAVTTFDLLRDFTADQLIETYRSQGIEIPADQLQGFLKMAMISAFFAMIAMSVAAPFVKGAMSHLVSLAYSASGTFRMSLSTVAYANMIVLFGTLLRIPLAMITGNYTFTFSPAILLPAAQADSAIYTVLSVFDVFTLWYLAVSVIGFRIVHRLSTGKAAVIVLVPWLISIVAALVPVLTGVIE